MSGCPLNTTACLNIGSLPILGEQAGIPYFLVDLATARHLCRAELLKGESAMKFIKSTVIMFLTVVVLIGTQSTAKTEIEKEIELYTIDPCLLAMANKNGVQDGLLSDEELLGLMKGNMVEELEHTIEVSKSFLREDMSFSDRMSVYKILRNMCINGISN